MRRAPCAGTRDLGRVGCERSGNTLRAADRSRDVGASPRVRWDALPPRADAEGYRPRRSGRSFPTPGSRRFAARRRALVSPARCSTPGSGGSRRSVFTGSSRAARGRFGSGRFGKPFATTVPPPAVRSGREDGHSLTTSRTREPQQRFTTPPRLGGSLCSSCKQHLRPQDSPQGRSASPGVERPAL